MNAFIQQFITESRDLVDQANTALGVLEQSPHDPEHRDALFRAFHTLKGGASIVYFPAMERAVHAVEDALSRTRAASHPVTTGLQEDCLECLDQIARWLDSMEHTGEVPPGADAQADAIIGRFRHASTGEGDGKVNSIVESESSASWLDVILHRHPQVYAQAKTAIRFTPSADSFFRGVDPIGLLASLPGLLSLDLEPRSAWPPLDELDPFRSILVLTSLASCSSEVAGTHLQGHAAECQIVTLSSDQPDADVALPPAALSVLEAQIALLADTESRTFAGKVASAGLVAANLLRSFGQLAAAELITRATERSLSSNDSQPLQEHIAQVLVSKPAPRSAPESSARVEAVGRTLRVDAARIDALVRLVGELTVAKNAIGHTVSLAQADENAMTGSLKDHHSILDRITSELQRAVLGIRVLPLRAVLRRFPRAVRELSSALDRPVKLVIEGEDTEADKAIVEMLFEPLLHIVRNSMDHGIEDSDERAKANKPSVATIFMRASRRGDAVLIEIGDDGRGIDVARVRTVAAQRGIASPADLETMVDAELIDLVFAAGFSTASTVTALSGRGVGMDAVRTVIGQFGGQVTIESHAGLGTTVRLTLPFSVMMTHVMTVEAAGQMFGIPLDAVVETIRVPAASIASVGLAHAIVHRSRTLPVFRLGNLLHAPETTYIDSDPVIVIATIAGHLGGIQVDRLGERMEIMLKPLEGLLSGTPGVVGTTILGDGRVLLVLDLAGVIQ
jgi:two-component system chemotaxis sensor kinase CheA